MSTKVKGDKIKENSIPLNALSKEVRDKINTSNIPAKYLIVESPGAYISPTFTKIDNSSIKCEISGFSIGGLLQEVKYSKGNVLIDCIRDGFIKLDTGDTLNGYEEEVFILRENNGDELIFEYVDGDDIDSAIAKLSTYKFYGWESGYSPAKIPQALINMPYIDPVVWKYLCNPCIIEFDRANSECNNAIPKELSDIIYQNGKFNHLVLSTVLIKIYYTPEESDEVVWKVERITSYNELGHVIFDGEVFGYEPNTRKFVY